jgi:hypothetical protein
MTAGSRARRPSKAPTGADVVGPGGSTAEGRGAGAVGAGRSSRGRDRDEPPGRRGGVGLAIGRRAQKNGASGQSG